MKLSVYEYDGKEAKICQLSTKLYGIFFSLVVAIVTFNLEKMLKKYFFSLLCCDYEKKKYS